jgi:hypothetical protein
MFEFRVGDMSPIGESLGPPNLDTSNQLPELLLSICFGGDVERVIPDPIPNSVVKPFRANGTAAEALWESRTPPDLSKPLA